MWMLYFSHYFTSFVVGLRRICLRAKVHNLAFINCSLLVEIDCVTDKLKATFSWMKNTFFSQNAENCILGLWNFKIFWARICSDPLPFAPPPPPLEKGDQRPLVHTVSYSIQTCWLLQFLIKPLYTAVTLGFERRPHWWEGSALTPAQPLYLMLHVIVY